MLNGGVCEVNTRGSCTDAQSSLRQQTPTRDMCAGTSRACGEWGVSELEVHLMRTEAGQGDNQQKTKRHSVMTHDTVRRHASATQEKAVMIARIRGAQCCQLVRVDVTSTLAMQTCSGVAQHITTPATSVPRSRTHTHAHLLKYCGTHN